MKRLVFRNITTSSRQVRVALLNSANLKKLEFRKTAGVTPIPIPRISDNDIGGVKPVVIVTVEAGQSLSLLLTPKVEQVPYWVEYAI
jgi:hypothetical protein